MTSLPKQEISTTHAKIETRNGQVFLIDVRSTNGTQLNGEDIEPQAPVKLSDGLSHNPFSSLQSSTDCAINILITVCRNRRHGSYGKHGAQSSNYRL